MARLAPTPLHLTDSERADLHTLINRHSTAQQIALRGRIILLADGALIAVRGGMNVWTSAPRGRGHQSAD